MWSLKHINLRGTGTGSLSHFPNYIASMDDSTDAKNKKSDCHADATLQFGTSRVLISWFGEHHDLG